MLNFLAVSVHQECAENMSFRVDKAWRQRCSQRFRNILDMVAKKAGPRWYFWVWPMTAFNTALHSRALPVFLE